MGQNRRLWVRSHQVRFPLSPDISGARRHVAFVPIPDLSRCSKLSKLTSSTVASSIGDDRDCALLHLPGEWPRNGAAHTEQALWIKPHQQPRSESLPLILR